MAESGFEAGYRAQGTVCATGVVHLELSDHKALKTICTDYDKFACANDCRHDPAPLEIQYDETRIDGWNGKLTGDQDFSGLPNLRTFWAKTDNMSTIDLSKNKNLKHVSIDNSSGPDAANTRLKLPAVNSIETLRVKSGTTLSAPLDLGSFTDLECGSFNMLAATDTALDLSNASGLRHLSIWMLYLNDLDLNPDVSLEYLYLASVGKINHLDIRNSTSLEEIKWGSGAIKSFTGNGLVFPPGYGPWYRDPELTERVTDNQCGRGETLYRYDYTSGSTRGTVAQKATASNAGLATASNGSAQSSSQSSGYPASGSTLWNQETAGICGVPKATSSNALLYWEDSFQDTWEDEEMLEELEQELVNDLFQAAALPIPPGTLPLPFKQSRPDNRLFYIPEDNRPWRPGQKR